MRVTERVHFLPPSSLIGKPIPRLPEDTLTLIIEFLTSPADLLSAVEMANSTLHVLDESEICYRTVCCFLGNDAVWRYFITRPEMASRVTELEILREDETGDRRVPEELLLFQARDPLEQGYVLPDTPPDPVDVIKSQNLLIEAVRGMVNLRTFKWDRLLPLVERAYGENSDSDSDSDAYPDDSAPESDTDEAGRLWTTLNTYCQLTQLSIIDLKEGLKHSAASLAPWNPAMFSFRGLTHVTMKLAYVPAYSAEGARSHDDSDTDDSSYKIALELVIKDEEFFHRHDGNPYTDIAPILAEANWPSLQHLSMVDISVDPKGPGVLNFLRRHPSLVSLRANLSLLYDDDLLHNPFKFPKLPEDVKILPSIETIDLPNDTLRTLVRYITYPSKMRVLRMLTPKQWSQASRPSYRLDLAKMLNLVDVTIEDVTDFQQIEKLAALTPRLEVLRIIRFNLPELYTEEYDERRYKLWLRYLIRWPRLRMVDGIKLWGSAFRRLHELDGPLTAIIAACPNLRSLGKRGEINVDENGKISFVPPPGTSDDDDIDDE